MTASLSVSAVENTSTSVGDLSIGVHAGLMGPGLNLGYKIDNQWDLKAEFNKYDYNHTGTESDIKYDFDMKLQSVGVLVNYRPFESGFRLTGGVFHNGNELSGNATYAGGDTLNIGGTTYNGSDVGSLSTKVDFNSFAPYVGVGFDMGITDNLTFGLDAGVLYQGAPKVSVNVTPDSGLSAPAAAQLVADAQTEAKDLEDELKDLKFLPSIKLSLNYRF